VIWRTRKKRMGRVGEWEKGRRVGEGEESRE
jgi:hypothetical protein